MGGFTLAIRRLAALRVLLVCLLFASELVHADSLSLLPVEAMVIGLREQ